MVKIRLKKPKKINEDMDLAIDKSYIKSIYDQLDTIINRKRINLQKLYANKLENTNLTIPLHKLAVPVKVKVNGKEIEVIPAQIANYCEYLKTLAMKNDSYGVIISQFQKPILWSFSDQIQTACCDGIRIAFNPLFAQKLIEMGKKNLVKGGSKQEINESLGKYFLFVLMHEAYHSLYRHMESAELKSETSGHKNAHLANIAMDAEINRDIEKQFPMFKGCTNTIDGILDTRFPVESWEDIFDAYYYKNLPPPASEDEKSNSSNIPKVEPNKKIKPKEQREGENPPPGPQPPTPEYSDDFKRGWVDGINDVLNNKVDPLTHIPKPILNDYTDGYEKAIETIKKGLEEGIELPPAGTAGKPDKNGLPQIPWDLEPGQTPPPPPPIIDPGQSNDNNDNNNDNNDNNNNNNNNIVDPGNPNNNNNNNNNNNDNNNNNNNNDNNIKDPGIKKPTDLSNKSSDYQRGYQDELNKELRKLGVDVPQISNSSFNGSEEEQAGREQARKDIKNIEKQIIDKIEEENENASSDEELMKQYEGTTIETSESSIFGGADIIPRDVLSKIAAEQGSPYTAEELSVNIDELNRDFQQKTIQKLGKSNPALMEKIKNLNDKLKARPSLADWRQKLKKHFHEAVKAKTEMKRSKKLLSQAWRADRAVPRKEIPKEINLGANLFYLIDNSGSMYFYNGNDVFTQIFKEIITMEKQCKILRSSRAFFSNSVILPSDVDMWDYKTPIDKVLKILDKRGSPDGTDIPGNVLAVTKLKKPQFVYTAQQKTTILIFTDGDNNFPGGWQILKQIPSNIRNELVFVLINKRDELFKFSAMIHEVGIKMDNIICIDISSIKKR